MNYYEELGILPSASVEEIRRSYKALARMLHPDQFPDQNLKGLAELQMKRLNQILAVLTDPEERLCYNQLLKALPIAPDRRVREASITPSRARLWSRPLAIGLCAWAPPVLGGILFIGGMVYYGTTAGAPSPTRTVETYVDAPAATSADSSPILPVRQRPRMAIGREDDLLAALTASQRELSALRIEHQKLLEQAGLSNRPPALEEPLPDPPPRPKPVLPDMHPAVAPVAAKLPAAEPSAASAAGLAGHWYYVPEAHKAPAKGIYVPEYIELRLTEDGGTLRGRYHARYWVTDQAISPEVNFQFEGPSGLATAQFPWTGAGDANGNVALRLVSADLLEVSWTASRLSANLNLASGTAQLIRQRELR